MDNQLDLTNNENDAELCTAPTKESRKNLGKWRDNPDEELSMKNPGTNYP